jgi:phosphonatase-like hydrolase
MTKIEMVVFDMAGTTVEDPGSVATCFHHAFTREKINVPPYEVNKVMGFRKRDAINVLLKKYYKGDENMGELAERIHSSFTTSMVKYYQSATPLRPLPHAEEIFSDLRSREIRVTLNTGFTKPITDAILKRLQWNGNFIDGVVSSDEVEKGRPDPAMIFELMRRLNISSAQNVMKIGDTAVDIVEGRNAGCGVVMAITTGAYDRKQLEECSPDHIIDNLEQIREFI